MLAVAIAVLFASALAAVWRSSARVRHGRGARVRDRTAGHAQPRHAGRAPAVRSRRLLVVAATQPGRLRARVLRPGRPRPALAARRAPRPGVWRPWPRSCCSAPGTPSRVIDEEFRRPAFREAVEYVEGPPRRRTPWWRPRCRSRPSHGCRRSRSTATSTGPVRCFGPDGRRPGVAVGRARRPALRRHAAALAGLRVRQGPTTARREGAGRLAEEARPDRRPGRARSRSRPTLVRGHLPGRGASLSG